MSDSKPNYYAILPANVRYDSAIKPNAKILYAEITALTQKEGKCWASNHYFSKLYGVSKGTISRWISQLSKRGYLSVEIVYKGDTKEIDKRYIQVSSCTINNPSAPIVKKSNTPRRKEQYPIDEKSKDIITRGNTTSNISDAPKFEEFWELYDKPDAEEKAKTRWNKLSASDKAVIIEMLPKWIKAKPDRKYRPHAWKFISEKRWKDNVEIPKTIDEKTDIGELQEPYDKFVGYLNQLGNIKLTISKREFKELIEMSFSESVKLHFENRKEKYKSQILAILTDLNSKKWLIDATPNLYTYLTEELKKAS